MRGSQPCWRFLQLAIKKSPAGWLLQKTQRKKAMSNWTDVAAEADLFEGAGIAVAPEGQDIALFCVDGEVFAIDNLCTHGNAKLCDGFVEGHNVECPFHQAQFSLRDGSVACGPATEPVKSWPVKIEGGRVFLQLA
jgi:naphthalene 1,2-dioxygenase system ferredoxin subunit